MSLVGYLIALPFIYLVSLLPKPLLYAFSDIVYLLLFRVIGYRKNVVLENLRNAFPEKSDKEIHEICVKYYRYLCDLLLETFKTLTINRKNIGKYCYLDKESEALFADFITKKQSFFIVLGHYGNWEFAGNAMSAQYKAQTYVIYHALTNKYFDKLIYKMRTRFGVKLIEMNAAAATLFKLRNEINAVGFIADQTPSNPENAVWINFLNQPTAVLRGIEVLSVKFKKPVVYVSINRISRGRYEINSKVLTLNPEQLSENELTKLHMSALEADILRKPEFWLWSHRRWKHKPNQNVTIV